MAVPKRDPLIRYLNEQVSTDADLRKVLKEAAADVDKALKSATGVRSAQLATSKVMAGMWKDIEGAMKIGIGSSIMAAIDSKALYDEDLIKASGFTTRYWRQSMAEQAASGIETYLARMQNGIGLSATVYKTKAFTDGRVDRAINSGILLGKSAAEIAHDVSGFINPDVPGGVSYASMRLARSELNNAFHTTFRNKCAETPWTMGIKWEISSSHPKPDECDDYAGSVHYKGGDPGVFKVDDCPDKPHPQCLCYMTPVDMDDDAFVKAFRDGKFDTYVEKTMGCVGVA